MEYLASKYQENDSWLAHRTRDPRLIMGIADSDPPALCDRRWERSSAILWAAMIAGGGGFFVESDGKNPIECLSNAQNRHEGPEYQWLADARDLANKGQESDALKTVYKSVNAWLANERFPWVESLLSQIHVEDFSVVILVALLTVTLRYHPKISVARRDFFDRVEKEIRRRGISEKGLLSGLG